MKPRAKFTPHLNTWAFWMTPNDWEIRRVGFGYSLAEAFDDWRKQQPKRTR